jgi:hypothetical protein
VFRVSFPVQGGPCGAADPAPFLSNRQTRACGWRRSRVAVRHRPGGPAAAAGKTNNVLAGRAGSGMTGGMQARLRWQGGRLVVIPSPDLMAITPRRDRKPGELGRRIGERLRPHHGVIETPSGDGMTTKHFGDVLGALD